jgi:hypothetical protein
MHSLKFSIQYFSPTTYIHTYFYIIHLVSASSTVCCHPKLEVQQLSQQTKHKTSPYRATTAIRIESTPTVHDKHVCLPNEVTTSSVESSLQTIPSRSSWCVSSFSVWSIPLLSVVDVPVVDRVGGR